MRFRRIIFIDLFSGIQCSIYEQQVGDVDASYRSFCFNRKLDMEKEQEQEYNAAQNIVISEDLISAAKRHLQFLKSVGRNRCLYDGLTLRRAIFRLGTTMTIRSFMEGLLITTMLCLIFKESRKIKLKRFRINFTQPSLMKPTPRVSFQEQCIVKEIGDEKLTNYILLMLFKDKFPSLSRYASAST